MEDRKISAAAMFDNFDYVRFTFTDFHGISRCKLIPARHAARFARAGAGIFSGLISCGPLTEDYAVKEIVDLNFPNAMLMPDMSTLRPVAWVTGSGRRTGQVLCETRWNDGRPQVANPRYMARQQLEKLAYHGYELMSAFELEFMMLDNTTFKPVFKGTDYMCTLTTAMFTTFLNNVDEYLYKMGVDIECMHTEHAPGQFEVIMKPVFSIDAADQAFLIKNSMKELAELNGWQANFMAKLDPKQSGNGTHFNFSLWHSDKKTNAFYNESKAHGLSDVARYWIAGLMKHSRALAALTAPTVNCYRRFHQPWAPDLVDWNIDDRTVALRVKTGGPSSTYMENRVPSGLSNPYLVLAGTVAAGLDGILNKLEPPPPAGENVERLPDDLKEALHALESDKVMVQALGTEFIEWFTGCKREVELKILSKSDPRINDADAIKAEFEEYARFA